MEKIALVEFGGSHDECLLSQMVALKQRGCSITFVSTKAMYERNPFFEDYCNDVHFVSLTGAALGDFKAMRDLNHFFRSQGIQKVILNTAQGGHVRNLCLTSSKNVEFIGIIHTLKKFQGSFTQRIIDLKIRKYFVLNDFFLSKIKTKRGQSVESFYPLRFLHFDKKIEKPKEEIWITIIGGVENRRKDLIGSLDLMLKTPPHCKFIFLGKSDPSSKDRQQLDLILKGSVLENRVLLFDQFVSAEDFDAYLNQTDIIWPMVHPNTPSADEYFRNQISGAINVSFSYKIPLLIHDYYFEKWDDLNDSLHYGIATFKSDFEKGLAILKDLKIKIVEKEKFNPEYQEKKYVRFIFQKH
jgi:hypothetical protein